MILIESDDEQDDLPKPFESSGSSFHKEYECIKPKEPKLPDVATSPLMTPVLGILTANLSHCMTHLMRKKWHI